MGEAKRRKQLDPNYGKSQASTNTNELGSLCYMTPSNLVEITTTLKEWQKQIKGNPKLFYKNYTRFFSSKFAQNNKIFPKNFPLNFYINQVLESYQEFEKFIKNDFHDLSDYRYLKGESGTIYSMAAVRRSKQLLNSSYAPLNEPMPWIEFIFVNPIFVNQGIGKLTVQYIVAELGSRIASCIYIDSAVFFEKLGFKLVIYRTHYDADYYIAENLTSPFNVYNISVTIPDSPDCRRSRSIDVACSSSQGIKHTLSIVMQAYPNCSRVEWKDIDNKKIYYMTADGSCVEYKLGDIGSTKTDTNLSSREIDLDLLDSLRSYPVNSNLDLLPEPDYQALTELYLAKGVVPLQSAICDFLAENNLPVNDTDESLSRLKQIAMTVFDIASKQSNNLASYDPKAATFTLKIPFELQDYHSYQPVQSHSALAKEAMALINTGFFNRAITKLINTEGDAIKTLRKYAIILYMGTNGELEIIDAACALARWKPFEIVQYLGEQRNSLTLLVEKTFKPLADKIQDFRVKQKRADKFPCLSLLCIVENKTTGDICEFRRHFTAQSGGQLIIPGFSDGTDAVVDVPTPMDIIGEPRKIPSIRGFNV